MLKLHPVVDRLSSGVYLLKLHPYMYILSSGEDLLKLHPLVDSPVFHTRVTSDSKDKRLLPDLLT